jgi:hypothetical protein
MRKCIFLSILFSINFCFAQVIKTKNIDSGGSGHYQSIAVMEKSLPNFTIYKPKTLKQATKIEGKLPLIVWANGGCMDSSINHERFLSELASHGYIIIAIGKLQMNTKEREHKPTPDEQLLVALDWIVKQSESKASDYYESIDLKKIAAAGMSCGGAQTLNIAGNNLIKTYMLFNSGMGEMTMASASSNSLKKLNGPILYVLGGPSDIAYDNAVIDYNRIKKVPVVLASHPTSGHQGTFAESFGGSFARFALDWLNWQFKGIDRSNIFIGGDLESYDNWSIQSKQF